MECSKDGNFIIIMVVLTILILIPIGLCAFFYMQSWSAYNKAKAAGAQWDATGKMSGVEGVDDEENVSKVVNPIDQD